MRAQPLQSPCSKQPHGALGKRVWDLPMDGNCPRGYACASCNCRHITLPLPLLGRALTNSTTLGAL